MKLIWGLEKQRIGNWQAFKHSGLAYRQVTEILYVPDDIIDFSKGSSDFSYYDVIIRFLLGILKLLTHHTVNLYMYGRSLGCYQKDIMHLFFYNLLWSCSWKRTISLSLYHTFSELLLIEKKLTWVMNA